MPPRVCQVSSTGPDGTRHTVEVTAETAYEAACMALAAFKNDGWTAPMGPGTRLEIEVKGPVVRHTVTVHQLQSWLEGASISPNEMVKKKRLKAMITDH